MRPAVESIFTSSRLSSNAIKRRSHQRQEDLIQSAHVSVFVSARTSDLSLKMLLRWGDVYDGSYPPPGLRYRQFPTSHNRNVPPVLLTIPRAHFGSYSGVRPGRSL